MRNLVLVLLSLASIAIAEGCGDGRPERVPIAGQVLIDGRPLAHGSVMFVTDNHRPAGGILDQEGRFQLTCYEAGDGAVRGSHKVKITATEQVGESAVRWHAPKRYADEKTSGIVVVVDEAKDDVVIELTWDGGASFVEK
jgi:hypothetical protein